MLRFARSALLGFVLGALAGLYLGWFQFPPEARNRTLPELMQRYRDEYAVMIAAGYAADQDLQGALERLGKLERENTAAYLQSTTDRIISTAAHDLDDIRLLVQLAHDLGALTPAMQPFLSVAGGEP